MRMDDLEHEYYPFETILGAFLLAERQGKAPRDLFVIVSPYVIRESML